MSSQKVVSEQYNGYARLFKEVKRRWREPTGHSTFGFFLFGSFFLFAAVGVWLEFIKLIVSISSESWSATAFRTAIATYFPAILGTTVLQLTISETLRSLRALGFIIALFFFALAAVLITQEGIPNWAAIMMGLFASAGALACWRIVYADDQSLRDDPEPTVATGSVDPVGPLLGRDALSGYDL